MKLDKIFTMFKKREHLSLYNKLYKDNDGETKIAMQYLCDGSACYALENLPLFEQELLNNMNGEDRTEIVL